MPDIVTENAQVRQWRVIEHVTCFNLAEIYTAHIEKSYVRSLPAAGLDWVLIACVVDVCDVVVLSYQLTKKLH